MVNHSGTGRDVTVPVNIATIVQSSCYLTHILRDENELLLDNKNKNTVEFISIPIPICIIRFFLDSLNYKPYFQIWLSIALLSAFKLAPKSLFSACKMFISITLGNKSKQNKLNH